MIQTFCKYCTVFIALILLIILFQKDSQYDENHKYIGCIGVEGGLGNQIWRIASLYGLGRFTQRKIFFEDFKDQRHGKFVNLTEINEIFPQLKNIIKIKNPNFKRKIEFAEDCCKYENPERLKHYKENYIQINAEYLQSYKFFHNYRNDIKKLFECGTKILSSVEIYSKALFKEDKNFKLCVHIRRGDFLREILLESKEDFVIPAINYAYDYLHKEKNLSLVFIGNDPEFVKALDIPKNTFSNVYYPQLKTRGEDMCFGINFCDSIILTASSSTFGWWISYLMKSEGQIFYNSQQTDYGNHSKDIYDVDAFLPNWISVTAENGKAKRETEWWHERNQKIY